MRRLVVAAGLLALVFGTAGVAVAQVEVTDAVILPWSEAEGVGFQKMLQRFSFGAYDIVNPAYRTAEDGSTSAVVVQYERAAPDGIRWEWIVTISRACDGCNTKAAKEAALLATEWDTRAHHWDGHPEFCTQRSGGQLAADATYWPCIEEHRLAGGLTGVEVYGHTLADRNQGYTVSTFTIVAGDYTVVVDGQVLKYGDYTAEYLEEFRTVTSDLADLYAAHLLSISGGGGSGGSAVGGTSGGPDAPIGYIAPVTAIGAIAAIAAVLATLGSAGAAGATGATVATLVPPVVPPVTGTFIDPDTGQALPVDGGEVWFGDWMPPDEAQKLIDQRRDEIELDKQAAAQHQEFVATQQGIRESELENLGFTFDTDSNTWVPGENTQAILDKKWQDKIAQDPEWQEVQSQFAAIQHELDTAKKQMLQNQNWHLQKDHDLNMEYEGDLATFANVAGEVKWFADTTINLLGEIPGGPRWIKWGYNSLTKGIEVGSKVDLSPQNKPAPGWGAGLEAGFYQLLEDAALDKVGDMISLKSLTGRKLPDDVWDHSFVDVEHVTEYWVQTKIKQPGSVSLQRLWDNSGRKNVGSLLLQRTKSEGVKWFYETIGKGPFQRLFGSSK